MLAALQLLSDRHGTAAFDCGVASLDEWPKRRALANQASGASRTFVVCEGNEVIACYALASNAVVSASAPGKLRRNMPDPISVVVLGRLAIASTHRGRGLGYALFQDAASGVIHAADAVGIRGRLVHALSEKASNFYLRLGLEPSTLDPMVLMVTLTDLRRSMSPGN